VTQLVDRLHIIGHWLRASPASRVLTLARCAGIAALLGVYADVSAQQSFGRLFFSTEERRTLDDMRNDDVEPQVAQPVRGDTAVAPVVDVISFDGKVERSGSGGSTIWVNGRPVLTGNRTVEGISVYSSRGTSGETRFVLPPSDAGQTDFSLKVGQKIAVQSGKVLDTYEARAAEDAESVFAKDPPGDASVPSDGVKTPKGAGSSATPAPSGGS
jgi:hypothetical protein